MSGHKTPFPPLSCENAQAYAVFIKEDPEGNKVGHQGKIMAAAMGVLAHAVDQSIAHAPGCPAHNEEAMSAMRRIAFPQASA